jgi:hypothetical protein
MSATAATSITASAPLQAVRSRSHGANVLRRLVRNPVAMTAAAIIGLLILVAAIFAPWIMPADPFATSMFKRLRPVGTPGYPLGTDELGRDMLTRLMYGGRLSLLMGVVPVIRLPDRHHGWRRGRLCRRAHQYGHHANARRVLCLPVGAAGRRHRRRARAGHQQQR